MNVRNNCAYLPGSLSRVEKLENPDVPGVLPCGTTVRGLAWTRCATPFATSRRSTSDPSTPRKMTKNSREDSRSVGRTREQSGGLKKKKKKRPFSLPHWTTYIAWICEYTIVYTVHFCVVTSHKQIHIYVISTSYLRTQTRCRMLKVWSRKKSSGI